MVLVPLIEKVYPFRSEAEGILSLLKDLRLARPDFALKKTNRI
jgi:hypothetical protein